MELERLVKRISDHALGRYRERVEPQANKHDIAMDILKAKPKHLRKLTAKKKTDYIPTEKALLVLSEGTVVTALARKK